MQDTEITKEIERLMAHFEGADEKKLAAMDGLIEQAAYLRWYLKQLNAQAMQTGMVKVHPENASIQMSLPVSKEIAKHSAAYTNIMDKLCKHLAPNEPEDNDDLDEFI